MYVTDPFEPKMDFSNVPCGSEINFMLSSVYFPGWKPVINIYFTNAICLISFHPFTVLQFYFLPLNQSMQPLFLSFYCILTQCIRYVMDSHV